MQRARCLVLVVLGVAAIPLAATQFGAGCLPGGGGGGVLFNLLPVPVLTADVTRGVAPLTVRFSSDGSTDDGVIVARHWDFGDGLTSEEISPSHTFTSTGDFRVTLTLTDDLGAQNDRSIIVSVTQGPIARISVDTRSAESAPAPIVFDGSSSFDPDGEIVGYQWDFGDGSRELLATVTHWYASAGTYRAKLTVTDDKGVTGTDEIVISVGIPQPEIELRVPPSDVVNIVVSPTTLLWVQAVFDVEPGVPYTLRAGLDGDTDLCEAQTVVFSANTGFPIITMTGHDDRVNTAEFSGDGEWILSGGEDGTIRLHDAVSGALAQEYDVGSPVTAVAFGPNATMFVYGQSDGAVVLRDRATGDLVRQFGGHAVGVNAVAFSPNGDQILSGGNDRHAYLWELSSGDVLRDFEHDLAVRAVAFSPADPTLVATGSGDQTAKIWNVTSGAELVTISGHADAVNAVEFAPDGGALLTGSEDGTARLWTLAGELTQTFAAGDDVSVTAVAFSPDGLLVVTGSEDGYGRVWDRATGELQYTLEPLAVYREPGGRLAQSDDRCSSAISAVDFSPDGLTVLAAVAAKNDIRLDSSPSAGNDLNLTYPAGLSLEGVPSGRYFVWTEVRTDRTPPKRDYAAATINVSEPFTSTIEDGPPVISLVNDEASVIVEPTVDRQIFDLGALEAGDRLYVSLLSVPGYGQFYQTEEFSVLILDANERMFAWLSARPAESGEGAFPPVAFGPEMRFIAGHNSANHYVVIDRGDSSAAEAKSVHLRVERGVGTAPREQRVFLNFDFDGTIAVGGLPAVTVTPFMSDDAGFRSQVVSRVQDLFSGYDLVVETSAPTPPYITVYFGGVRPTAAVTSEYGFADHIDPRNDTLTGSAIVFTESLAADFALSEQLVGNVAARQIGLLLGLRLTTGNNSDIMGESVTLTNPLLFTESSLAPIFTGRFDSMPGTQNAPLLFGELLGAD